jgi:type III restriction enzyme
VKLPSTFVIYTPLGSYNPDWAVLVENEGVETLFFVVETKGSIDQKDLRLKEVERLLVVGSTLLHWRME